MPRYVAFLRGINLGRRRFPMSRLKELCEELGLLEVETFIASGNVVFSSNFRSAAGLEAKIAGHLEASLGYEVDTFVRRAEEVIAIGNGSVFPCEAAEGITVHVGFFHQALPRAEARKLEKIRTKDDEFRVVGREYYWLCRVKITDSKVWTLPGVKALRFPTSTIRNMTSIRKLIAKHLV